MKSEYVEYSQVTTINVSEDERKSGRPSSEIVGAAVSALHRDGIVVLNNVVDVAHIDKLNSQMIEEIPVMLADDTRTVFNGTKEMGNIAQSPPVDPASLYPDIWANHHALAVLSCMLGPTPHCNYVQGNTALPHSSERQHVHADLSFNYPSMPFSIVANYVLTNMDESNGATEVWLGSHRDTHFDMHLPSRAWIDPKHLDTRREAGFPPIRPAVKKGSVILRDLRLWHAGIPNTGDTARVMLAFVYYPWWYSNHSRIVLPDSARPIIEQFEKERSVIYGVDYVQGEVDHKKLDVNTYFSSENQGYNSQIPPRANIPRANLTKQELQKMGKAAEGE